VVNNWAQWDKDHPREAAKYGHTQGTKDAIDQAYRNRDKAEGEKSTKKAASKAEADTKRSARERLAEARRTGKKAEADTKRAALDAKRTADKDAADSVRLAEQDEKSGRPLTTHQKALLAAARAKVDARKTQLRGASLSNSGKA
jgi:hypothetical protein